LINLQSVVRKMGDTGIDITTLDLPGELGQISKRLAAAEVPSAYARELMECLGDAVPEAERDDIDKITDRLVQIVAQRLPTCDGIQYTAGQRRVVALVGPAGVGKTTMIAKLAAEYHLRLKRRVGLITADNFRIAAVDQLRTFADIIDAPLNVVTTPREMRAAIQQLQDRELVLIDTPGRSPEDDIKLQELKSILADGEPDEVHLVQSCVSTKSHWRRCFERFSAVGLTALMLTKMDEAVPAGHLAPILTRAQIPVSYISDGQVVPDDVQTAEPLQLAKRLLATPRA
jgi:flagellar biosynthesis protein FlhF